MITEHLLNDAASAAVLSEWSTPAEYRIGVVTLNAPKTLNSLTLEMIDVMDPQMRAWAADEAIVAVYLRGSGDRAFCAGGDIQALYHSMQANHDAGARVDHYAETFFEREYRLDHLIHCFPKPVLCFGTGVVMGGGLGLLSASSHRVVTETSRVAMPEITIGLFPDAGGTALLSSMPGSLGLYLGLTGTHINGADALVSGLGRYLVRSEVRSTLEQALVALAWTGDADADGLALDAMLQQLDGDAVDDRPDSLLAQHRDLIDAALGCVGGDYAAAIAGVRSLPDGKWFDRGKTNLESGCPATAGIVVEQLDRARNLSLAEMFRMELVIGTHCARNRDFAEGVRALLIDKDGAPAWTVNSLDALSRETVLGHFESPWEENPLADLQD